MDNQALQAQVHAALVSGENPVDFVTKNLNRTPPAQVTIVPVPQEKPVEAAPNVQPLPNIQQSFREPEPAPPPPPPPAVKEPTVEAPVADMSVADDNASDVELTPEEIKEASKVESLRAMRKNFNETKTKLEATQAELEEERANIARYESGEKVPEKVQGLERRVGELEPYEKLHAFKLSKEYQTEHVEPIEQLKTSARELAKEYEVDPGIFDVALKLSNKKEVNAYLSKYLDPVGALEAREIIEELHERTNARIEAERKPQEELQRIREENQQKEQQALEAEVVNVKKRTNTSWSKAFESVTASDLFPELTLTEADEHYATVTKPVQEAAGRNFGMLVSALTKSGAKNIPDEVLQDLAKFTLLAQLAPITAQSRMQHNDNAQEILANTARQSQYKRPGVAGGVVGVPQAASNPFNAPTLEENLQRLVNNVLQKKTA